MSTALALRLEFAMRSLEVAAEVTPSALAIVDRVAQMRPLVDQAIEELTS